MEALATQPTRRGSLIPDAIDGYRVGWFPGSHLIYAEGHPAEGQLCRAGDLDDGLSALVRSLRDHGIELPAGRSCDRQGTVKRAGLAGLRRLDLTVDLDVGRGVDGLALLAGMGSIEVPRLKSETLRERGGRAVETITWKGSRGIVARMYDKGIESGTQPRGEYLRLEAQLRYQAGGRLDPTGLNAHHVRARFIERFAPLWQATKGVNVVGALAAPQKITELVRNGDITGSQGDRLLGFIIRYAAGHELGYDERTVYRRRAELRKLGLVAADGVLEEIEVDLASVLDACMDSATWGTDGG